MQAPKRNTKTRPGAKKSPQKRQLDRPGPSTQQGIDRLLLAVRQSLTNLAKGNDQEDDPVFIIKTTYDVVEGTSMKERGEKLVKGRIKLSEKYPPINTAIYDIYKYSRAVQGHSIEELERDVAEACFVEFACNLKRNADGSFELIQHHFVGFEGKDPSGLPMKIEESDDDTLQSLIDFLWNAWDLKLCDEQKLKSFLSKANSHDERLLLTEDEVEKLEKSGQHAQFDQETLDDALACLTPIWEFSHNLAKIGQK